MKNIFRFALVTVFFLALTVSASTPQLINYQATLTTPSGTPVVDNDYTVTFTIYDSPLSGESKWTETRVVATTNGQFTILLGAVNPIMDSVFREPNRFLGIKVGSDPEALPRARLVSMPYGFRTSTIDGAIGGSLDGSIIITPTTFDSLGNAITIQDGSDRTAMTITVKNDNVASVDFYDPVDSRMGPNVVTPFRLRLDKNGITFFGTDSSDTSFHVAADGDLQSIGEQTFNGPITIGGDGIDGRLNIANYLGDTTVYLDTLGIRFHDFTFQTTAATNTGAAQETEGLSSFTLTDAGGLTQILRRTINCPVAGYVMVIGTCQPIYSHVNGTATSADFGVSEDSLTWDSDQDHSWSLASALPTGTYNNTISVTKIFPVSAGTESFFLLGDKFSGTNDPSVYDATLSLIFISKSYGTVAQSVSGNNDNENQYSYDRISKDSKKPAVDSDLTLKALQLRINELETRLNEVLKDQSKAENKK